MRIIAMFFSLLLTANFVHAKVYNCKGVDGYSVKDFEFDRFPVGFNLEISFAENIDSATGIIDGEYYGKQSTAGIDIYAKGTIIFVYYRKTSTLLQTYTNTPDIGGQLSLYIEYKCE